MGSSQEVSHPPKGRQASPERLVEPAGEDPEFTGALHAGMAHS